MCHDSLSLFFPELKDERKAILKITKTHHEGSTEIILFSPCSDCDIRVALAGDSRYRDKLMYQPSSKLKKMFHQLQEGGEVTVYVSITPID